MVLLVVASVIVVIFVFIVTLVICILTNGALLDYVEDSLVRVYSVSLCTVLSMRCLLQQQCTTFNA